MTTTVALTSPYVHTGKQAQVSYRCSDGREQIIGVLTADAPLTAYVSDGTDLVVREIDAVAVPAPAQGAL